MVGKSANGDELWVLGHFGHGHFGLGRFGLDISATDVSATEKMPKVDVSTITINFGFGMCACINV